MPVGIAKGVCSRDLMLGSFLDLYRDSSSLAFARRMWYLPLVQVGRAPTPPVSHRRLRVPSRPFIHCLDLDHPSLWSSGQSHGRYRSRGHQSSGISRMLPSKEVLESQVGSHWFFWLLFLTLLQCLLKLSVQYPRVFKAPNAFPFKWKF